VNLRDENVLREMNLYPLWVRKGVPAQIESIDTQVLPVRELVPDASPIPTLPLVGEGLNFPLMEPLAMRLSPQAGKSLVIPTGEGLRGVGDVDWPSLKQRVKDCTACTLRAGCTQTVFGVGDENADWLFVGEGPGADEDAQGEPFVGQAGKLLDNMLAAIKLKRGNNVYIANIVKCRPPNNRAPEPDEVATCLPFLKQQIALIKPKLIVALGKTAATSLLGKEATLGSMRGTLHDFEGTPLLVTYHPAYLLRSPAEKAKAWQDLCTALSAMNIQKTDNRMSNYV
jgi:DNA polymerase